MRKRRPDEELDREERSPEELAGDLAMWTPSGGRSADAVVARLAEADAGTRAAALERLQRGSGNASVGRMLARRERSDTEDPFDAERAYMGGAPAIKPHAPGQDADTPRVLQEAATTEADGEPTGSLELPAEATQSEVSAAPQAEKERGGKETPKADKAIVDWAAEQPTTNPEYAQWILDAGTHGFATYAWNSKPQLQTYAAGRRHSMTSTIEHGGQQVREQGGTIDGSATAALIPVLETARSIILGRANRWVQDPSKPKVPLRILWLARNWAGDAHNRGTALDAAGGISFGNRAAGQQVVQLLHDLPRGSYLIGLPYQVPFFDPRESLLHYTNAAKAEAKRTGGDPADVTTPSLLEWKTVLYTAKWNKTLGDFDNKAGGTSALSMIQDSDVRDALGGFEGRTFTVMPDRPEHIHIQRT